jgi:hypothetical protein
MRLKGREAEDNSRVRHGLPPVADHFSGQDVVQDVVSFQMTPGSPMRSNWSASALHPTRPTVREVEGPTVAAHPARFYQASLICSP